jgi:hypothetical protein
MQDNEPLMRALAKVFYVPLSSSMEIPLFMSSFNHVHCGIRL